MCCSLWQLGRRGRHIVAERNAAGEETKVDSLMHVEDGSAFDQEWQSEAQRAELSRAQRLGVGFPGLGGYGQERRPALTQESRDMMAAGRDAHAANTERMIKDARDYRAREASRHGRSRYDI